MRSILTSLLFASVVLHPIEQLALAQPRSPDEQVETDWADSRWGQTDVGPYLANSIVIGGRTTNKGLAIKVGDHAEATVCFDTDQLRYSGAWSGGFLKLSSERFGLTRKPAADGTIIFQTSDKTGWIPSGPLADTRPIPYGPLPETLGRYNGVYFAGPRAAISYRLKSFDVLESPWIETHEGISAITRDINITRLDSPARHMIAELEDSAPHQMATNGVHIAYLQKDNNVVATALRGADLVPFANEAGQLLIDVISRAYTLNLKLFVWSGNVSDLPKFAALVAASPETLDLSSFTKGGPARWGGILTTQGTRGSDNGGFAIDTLTLPYKNPWNALMFVGGHDFLPDGRGVVCTAHGDVWIVSGIDEDLQVLRWKRYATGLHHPLGLKVVDDDIYILGSDQITIPRDLNNDGEADFYENFNNGFMNEGGDHQFATCLETDPQGNFYFLTCASGSPHGGCLMQVSADGKNIGVVATGFRNPNGMSISPVGLITAADQQGNWVPETRLDIVGAGGFYGYFPTHKRPTPPRWFNGPLCFIPRAFDNSAGGQVWVPDAAWDSLGGKLLHLSYGRCSMMLTLMDQSVPGQGGIVPLPGRFLSGAMRGRFNSSDGHLYVSGLNGWQTAALRDGSLQRVRRTAQPLNIPTEFSSHENGIRIRFSDPLDANEAGNPENYSIEQWNYHWTEEYGSADWSPSKPLEHGRDSLPVKAAHLVDAQTVFLEIENLLPVMQMQINYSLQSQGGRELESSFALTTKSYGPPFHLNTAANAE